MATYLLTCNMGIPPRAWTVEADSKESAAGKFLGKSEVKEHFTKRHPDIMSKPFEEQKQILVYMIAKIG